MWQPIDCDCIYHYDRVQHNDYNHTVTTELEAIEITPYCLMHGYLLKWEPIEPTKDDIHESYDVYMRECYPLRQGQDSL